MKFEVGSWYFFKIVKVSDVPEKGKHYVLHHESGRKMLLNTQYYVKYRFDIGQTIECRVDKVNCTGQVFLEPRHPVYDEGSLYTFKKLSIKENVDKTLNLLVKDSFDNEIEVCLSEKYEIIDDEYVSLKVERIKKGFPSLVLPIAQEIKSKINFSDTLILKVVALISENSEDYYSLMDSSGKSISRLKVKHYWHYGIKIGSNYICKIIGFSANGLMLVEPENPWYKIGESYLFKINTIEDYINLSGKTEKNLLLLDKSSNKCGVSVSVEQLKQIENQNEVKCKVIGFRKGRPQLEIDLY